MPKRSISRMSTTATESCGCVFCDLNLPPQKNDAGRLCHGVPNDEGFLYCLREGELLAEELKSAKALLETYRKIIDGELDGGDTSADQAKTQV